MAGLTERLGLDRAAGRAGRQDAARIDQHNIGTRAFCLVPDEPNGETPRGVVDGSGELGGSWACAYGEHRAAIEIITGRERRRRCTAHEKVRFVEETMQPGMTV
ncbi:helix-turn-helix domain-containing protein [Methylobacterium radiotolerans]|uniref:hypothetical protein n=1 Tax=Methylobacterium radiotolerans TaxID=31998 RepID=UPI001F1A070A|nr:hypothetical protein [Methylobacterium radiotolerans]UIY45248.1 hypothetical protein LZ599_30785 [Methylobacterium radiotolerans]